MLITYMTKMMMMFSGIIVVGLFLTWVNDGLEHLFSRFRFNRFRPEHLKPERTRGSQLNPVAVQHVSIQQTLPSTAKLPTVRPSITKPFTEKLSDKLVIHKPVIPETPQHDYAAKIVKIDLAPRSRESDSKLGEHVTILPKAA